MEFISAKHLKKKRRVDESSDDTSPGPSNEVLPLVAPQMVRKSSKDPNRGMYPRSKEKFGHFSQSCPQFVKASELRSRQMEKDKKSKSPNSEHCDPLKQALGHACKQVEECISSDIQATDTKSNTAGTRKPFYSHSGKGKRTRGASFPNTTAANKITKYFKCSPNSTKRHKVSRVKTQPIASETPSTSGWVKKDEEYKKLLENNERLFKTLSDCYGLLGSTVKEDGEDYFNKLPSHIIENILCQIPISDLMSCRLVCTRWTEIIDAEKFLEWKKAYYRFKKQCPSNDTEVTQDPESFDKIILSFGHEVVTGENYMVALVNYMANGFNRRPSEDMYDLLMKNSKGKLADQVITERFSELDGKDSRVWCQFTVAVLICETVWEIYEIYKSLFVIKSACSRHDVIDAMYCIATALLYFRNTKSINYGLHYRVYYVLYLIENHIPSHQREKLKFVKGLPGQQSIHSYSKSESAHLTYEQIRVLNHHFELNQKVRIIALAGTGKTTTLLHLARLYPQIKFLNLVFNKAVSDDAKRRFPSNVTCQTAHSLAYGSTGRFLRHKLTTKIRPFELISHIQHNEGNMQIYCYANLVLNTINSFVNSTATEMSLVHVPYLDYDSKKVPDSIRDRILLDAFHVWEKMINKDDLSVKITHDVYLKLYHLRKPKLHKYQCIMVDEAQDCNPVILDIVLSQNVPVILVGDPHQQIYGFRGAHNALDTIKATHTYYLTKSFRFGPEIAYLASCILELLLSAKKNTIVGSSNNSYVNGKVEGQYAVITRTNIELFNQALRMVVFKNLRKNEPDIINAAFAGGIKGYGFDQILDIGILYGVSHKERVIKDKFISKFKSFNDLSSYAKYADDTDLRAKISLVKQYGSDIFKYISILYDKCSHPIELANVVFSTAHKAKGLEFDSVYLTEDFPFVSSVGFQESGDPFEEINIFYVALTRAKRCVLLPEHMMKALLIANEKFEYPVASAVALGDKAALKCVQCKKEFSPHTVLLLMRRQIVLGNGREIDEGHLCMKCGSDPYMRPEVHLNGVIMLLDPTEDYTHRFMAPIVGPLPSDPPIVHDRFAEYENYDHLFVINLNLL